MTMTNSTCQACITARRALCSSRPILHIVTDDFKQMMEIMDQAFFEIAKPEGASDRYISLSEILRESKANKESARENWLKLIRSKGRIIYLTADADGELSDAVLDHLMDYQEQHRISWYCSKEPLASRIVIYGRKLSLPATLESQVARVELPELNKADFRIILKDLYKPSPEEKKTSGFTGILEKMAGWYADQLAGFPENEIRSILQELLYAETREEQQKQLFSETVAEKIIRREKNKRLNVHGKLDCLPTKNRVIGLEPVIQWLQKHKVNITRSSFASEEDITKGILLLGLPGTGKSLLANSCAAILNLPLIRLDISRLLGRYVGDSEKNMDQVLQDLTVAGAPCVLWIDELDKAYSGVGKESGGSSVMDRLFGKMLTFMQEMRRTVFLVATANDISALPPELFRSGRFSQIFSLMLPSYDECVAILNSKLEHHLGEDGSKTVRSKDLMDICSGLKRWNGYSLVERSDSEAIRFLTGADISLMAQEMCIELGLIPGGGDSKGRQDAEIYAAMQRAVNRCRATVDSHIPLTLERAARSYHKVLEQGAISANAVNAPICKANYQPGNVSKSPSEDKTPQCMKAPNSFPSDYDKQMYFLLGRAIDECIKKGS